MTAIFNGFSMTDAQFQQLAKIIRDRSGIQYPATKKGDLESRLGRRLRELEIENYDQYVSILTVGPYQWDEFGEMLNRIMIGDASFIRMAPHRDVVETQMLPRFLEKGEAGERTLIGPFIISIQNVFSTMMQLPVSIGEPRIKDDTGTTYEVSGMIVMSGDVAGSVVLSLPQRTALRVVALFSGSEVTPDNPDFGDAVGELVNMICGGAKGLFRGKKVTISCPSVVVGESRADAGQRETPCIVVPCTTDFGELALEIALREASKAAGIRPSAGATA